MIYSRILRGEREGRVRGVGSVLEIDGLETDEADGSVREVGNNREQGSLLVLAVLPGAGVGRENDGAGGGEIDPGGERLDHGLKY